MKYMIEGIPPSLNRYAGRKNCWEYREEKQRWKLRVIAAVGRDKPVAPLKHAVVGITYYFPDKIRRDPDNYAGKMLLDGLTAAGVIRDDSFKNIELRLRGEVDPSRPRVEIEVEECGQY